MKTMHHEWLLNVQHHLMNPLQLCRAETGGEVLAVEDTIGARVGKKKGIWLNSG